MNVPIFQPQLNAAYNAACSLEDKVGLKFLTKAPEINAFLLGYAGGWLITRGIQKTIQWITPTFYEEHLPTVEKVLSVAVASTPLIYGLIDPQGLQNVMASDTRYTSGIIGGLTGGLTAAFGDAHKERDITDKLYRQIRKHDKPSRF